MGRRENEEARRKTGNQYCVFNYADVMFETQKESIAPEYATGNNCTGYGGFDNIGIHRITDQVYSASQYADPNTMVRQTKHSESPYELDGSDMSYLPPKPRLPEYAVPQKVMKLPPRNKHDNSQLEYDEPIPAVPPKSWGITK